MTSFARTEFFSTNDTLEKHVVHSIMAYSRSVTGQGYLERSGVDNQPFAFYQVGTIASDAYSSRRAFIARLAILLDPDGDAGSTPLYEQAIELPTLTALPNSLRATS